MSATSFRALRATPADLGYQTDIQQLQVKDLSDGNVTIKSHYSSINYKDALAITGKGKILRKLPLNPGIDVAGTVLESKDPAFVAGQEVLVTGCGLGETFDGGLSEMVRISSKHIVPLPNKLSLRETMIYGTAGFTAGLCVERMLNNGQTPDKGPILVTGASGGVGSFAVSFFSKLDYEVWALTGKSSQQERLHSLGAKQVISPEKLSLGSRPLESVRFGGVVDNIGGETLSKVLAHVQLWGNVASVGLTSGASLNSTVMPMILRGVSLLGISSANTPMSMRTKIWNNLADSLKPGSLENFCSKEISLDQAPEIAMDMINRKTHGRYLVNLL